MHTSSWSHMFINFVEFFLFKHASAFPRYFHMCQRRNVYTRWRKFQSQANLHVTEGAFSPESSWHERLKGWPLVTVPCKIGTTTTTSSTKWKKVVEQNAHGYSKQKYTTYCPQLLAAKNLYIVHGTISMHAHDTSCGCFHNRSARSCTVVRANEDGPDLILSLRLKSANEVAGTVTACFVPCPISCSWRKAKRKGK